MPVVVELLHSANYQEQGDLQKIYRDAPAWLFAPATDAAQLIKASLEDRTLLVARLNDRLLGAARLQRHDTFWELSQMCVRSLTRRRGVAERLVLDAQQLAAQAGCPLRLLTTTEMADSRALASKLGITLRIASLPGSEENHA